MFSNAYVDNLHLLRAILTTAQKREGNERLVEHVVTLPNSIENSVRVEIGCIVEGPFGTITLFLDCQNPTD